MMIDLIHDIRYAIRIHSRQPKTALIMIFTLALGIGVATSVFTVVQAVLLRPLLYSEPDNLLRVYESNPSKDAMYFSVSAPNWQDWRSRTTTFRDLGALARTQDLNLIETDQATQITGTRVSSNLLPLLGVQAILGRNFTAAADRHGQEYSVILSHDFWKAHFGGNPEILQTTLMLDNKQYAVIGVMPPGFRLPFNDASVYLPLALSDAELKRNHHFLRVIGRLKSGIKPEQAISQLRNLAASLEKQYPDTNTGWTVISRSLNEVVIPTDFRRALWILFFATGLVLMIACLNVSNLMIARTLSRQREISIRRAMGARNMRLFAQFLTESCLIAIVAGVAGVFLAVWLVDFLHALEPGIPRIHEIRVDTMVLVFAIGVSFLTVLVFGTLAAFQGIKKDIQEGLKEGTLTGTPGARRTALRNALVITEASMAIVLLIGSGLLIKSLLKLHFLDPGFNPAQVLVVRITTPEGQIPEPEKVRDFYTRIQDRLAGQQGIQKIATASQIPLGPGNAMEVFTIAGSTGETLAAAYRIVSPEYFTAMGISIVQGRTFDSERRDSVIIDTTAHRKFWPNENPVGKRIQFSGINREFEIQGIANEVRSLGLDEDPLPTLYVSSFDVKPEKSTYLVVRSSGNLATLAPFVRNAIREADAQAILGTPTAMTAVLSESLTERRFNVWVFGIFAAIALILAGIGLFSVIAYSVSQRTHEIGIRMALGAKQKDVVLMIVRQGLALAITGTLVGLVASFAVTRMLASLLYLVNPTDAFTFQAGSIFFLLVACLASYIPARRAASLNPVTALKHE